jgi:hypothetical protein
MTVDLNHINNRYAVSFGWKIKYWVTRKITGALTRMIYEVNMRRELDESIGRFSQDIQGRQLTRQHVDDLYTPEFEEELWRSYFQDYTNRKPEKNVTVFLAQQWTREVRALLRADPKIRSVVNFGVSCAYGDWQLAAEFPPPPCGFWGIDRSAVTKKLNEEQFPLPNLKFEAADIFEFLQQNHCLQDGVLIHVRTCVFLLPEAVRKLYKMAADAGIKYIVCIEPTGLSRQTNSFYKFSLQEQKSVIYRGVMLIHNYPYLMHEAGYEIVSGDLLKPYNENEDHRALLLVAVRSEKGQVAKR